ncbi:transcription factor mef2A-like [Daktulosphaira vitifoliae]|uniref:transcription factor mef2A-like n=1 Tax=Daktulosphaira vitifoliae TaxID=58002 RepID=UPI0021AA79C9|nr:transcription factor mef2A-like [Daktulosphaira vitifoliae]
MYFIQNDTIPVKNLGDNLPAQEPKLSTLGPSVLSTDQKMYPETSCEYRNTNHNLGKRVYGRARASLNYSSFYIFCEDFRKQVDFLYSNKTEIYRKNLLNYMWKHLNPKDKHKYYETATKARSMYVLPENPFPQENDQTIHSIQSAECTQTDATKQQNKPSGSAVIGKLVTIKFSKSCNKPIITPLRDNSGKSSSNCINQSFEECEKEPGEEQAVEGQKRQQDEVYGVAEQALWKENNGEVSQHQDHCAQYLQSIVDHGDGPDDRKLVPEQRGRRRRNREKSRISYWNQSYNPVAYSSPYASNSCRRPKPSTETGFLDLGGGPQTSNMLQQYQQQPDYTPYGGMGGYSTQQNSGYFNYSSSEASWFSPSSASDHSQMHGGLSHNSCNINDNAGNYLSHGYNHSPTGGTGTSSVDSYASNSGHTTTTQQSEIDPMAEFLSHPVMNESDKIKDESIDWLSTIINDDGSDQGAEDIKLSVCELPVSTTKGQESNGRLPNFHQAFGSTEIGRFSQHEYYEPPKESTPIVNECSSSQPVTSQQPGESVTPQPLMSYEPPRQPSRRGRGQRGGGQHRRNKTSRTTSAAAAAAAAVATQQFVGYDMAARHQSPYHHDPYSRSHHQQRYQDQHYHHQQHQAAYQNNHDYYRQQQHHQQQQQQQYERMHHHYQSSVAAVSTNQYYGQRDQYANTGYNRFHSCCSSEHISRPNHHSYGGGGGGGGPGQYYNEYNAYNQWS